MSQIEERFKINTLTPSVSCHEHHESNFKIVAIPIKRSFNRANIATERLKYGAASSDLSNAQGHFCARSVSGSALVGRHIQILFPSILYATKALNYCN